jgi:hypothetical protein
MVIPKADKVPVGVDGASPQVLLEAAHAAQAPISRVLKAPLAQVDPAVPEAALHKELRGRARQRSANLSQARVVNMAARAIVSLASIVLENQAFRAVLSAQADRVGLKSQGDVARVNPVVVRKQDPARRLFVQPPKGMIGNLVALLHTSHV